MALDTVDDYISEARVLMQDEVEEYRYPDASLVSNLNQGLMEMRRLRPDMFIGRTVPSYSAGDTVAVDEQFRQALLFFIIGMAQLRDEEDTQDARASQYLASFRGKLLSVTA